MSETCYLPRDIPLGPLFSIIFRSRSIILNHHLKPLDLSAGQFPLIIHLMYHENITQETLVKHFHLDRGTIARSVKKLEDSGYVIRKTEPENRREVRLFLSDKGKEVAPELIRIGDNWEEMASSALSDVEKQQFKDFLLKIASASIEGVKKTEIEEQNTENQSGGQ